MENARLSALTMPVKVRTAFEIFIGMGDERSLVKLSQTQNIPLPTVKRWSKRYDWFDLAKLTDEKVSQQLADAQVPHHVARVEKALEYFDKLKEKFYERVDKDEIVVGLDDFLTILKAENVLRGEAAMRDDAPVENKVVNNFLNVGSDQVVDALRVIAATKHGLPVNVTPPK